MTQQDIPLFPVAAVTVGPVPRMGLVVMRPDFLTTLMDKPEDAQHGRTYAMTPVQVRDLVQLLQSALRKLDESPPPTGLGTQH